MPGLRSTSTAAGRGGRATGWCGSWTGMTNGSTGSIRRRARPSRSCQSRLWNAVTAMPTVISRRTESGSHASGSITRRAIVLSTYEMRSSAWQRTGRPLPRYS